MIRTAHAYPSLSPLATLVDLLRVRGEQQPDTIAFTFLRDETTHAESLTYGALDRHARVIGTLLQDLGATGERVLLLYPSGLDYIAAFFGCLYAGAIAVPAFPPRSRHSFEHIRTLATDAEATFALTTTDLLAKTPQWCTWVPELLPLRWLATDALATGMETAWRAPAITSDSLALLQYTSGTPTTPKGVMLPHGTLLWHMQQLQHILEHSEESIGVGWLPFHHDMGLLGNIIQPLYAGFPCILMSPMAFLQRPLRWLQAISHYRATTSGGPNFAYDICVQKIAPAERDTLDLHSWNVALNGSEPVRHGTLERFAQAFATCGFRRQVWYPWYGLAEATLMVSGGRKQAEPITRTVQYAAMAQHQHAIPCIGTAGSQTLVSRGTPLPNHTILIVDPETRTVCPPHQVGEVWIAGASVAQGYWNQPHATTKTFQAYVADTGSGPFLRTGDLGFMHRGELFIVGRRHDRLILHDPYHAPDDIEATVEQSHFALRPGCGTTVTVPMEGAERLVIVYEVEGDLSPKHPTKATHYHTHTIINTIRQAVVEAHKIEVAGIVLLHPGTLPKTPSGAIQRDACRLGLLHQSLDVLASWYLTPIDHEQSTTYAPTEDTSHHRELATAHASE